MSETDVATIRHAEADSASHLRLSVAEAAALTGIPADTLRYYERAGLMREPVPRTASGRRIYRPQDIRWVETIAKLRTTDMPISAIRSYTELARRGDETAGQRLALLTEHRRTVKTRLAAITQALDLIDQKIDHYHRLAKEEKL